MNGECTREKIYLRISVIVKGRIGLWVMHDGVRGSVVYSALPHVHVEDMSVPVACGAEKFGAQRALVVLLAVDFDDVPALVRAGPKRSVAETTRVGACCRARRALVRIL